jgi:hypothetical protein
VQWVNEYVAFDTATKLGRVRVQPLPILQTPNSFVPLQQARFLQIQKISANSYDSSRAKPPTSVPFGPGGEHGLRSSSIA